MIAIKGMVNGRIGTAIEGAGIMKKSIGSILGTILSLCIGFSALATENPASGLPISTEGKTIIDFHAHVAGLGYGNSGCFINEKMRKNFRFPFYLMAMGVSYKELREQGDAIVFKKISDAVAKSSSVNKTVILAMDGVIDTDGNLDKELTQIYVPNEYVYAQTQKYSNLLYAASINPYRKDAVQRLEQAKANGAVLIKWLPSIMHIDPADPAIIPFYQKMIELDMPLLTHTGMEKSFSSARDELADPQKLVLPLSMGVTVIAAHIATTGKSHGEDNFERILPMFKQYPTLYGDISSLTQANKLGFMRKVVSAPELQGRLIYGTDWPLQFFPLVSAWYHLGDLNFKQAITISRIRNQWDRDVALKRALGVQDDVFQWSNKILNRQG